MKSKGNQLVTQMNEFLSEIKDLQELQQILIDQKEFVYKIKDLGMMEVREEEIVNKIKDLELKYDATHDYFMSKCDF